MRQDSPPQKTGGFVFEKQIARLSHRFVIQHSCTPAPKQFIILDSTHEPGAPHANGDLYRT
jgi:hypothetical protein